MVSVEIVRRWAKKEVNPLETQNSKGARRRALHLGFPQMTTVIKIKKRSMLVMSDQ